MANGIPQLCTFSGQSVIRKRREGDTYVGGRLSEGTVTVTEDIPASVQPLTSAYMRAISQLMEGKRSSGWIVVFCEVNTFREANDKTGTPSDILTYEDEEYEVQKVDHRTGRRLRHDQVYASRVD